MLNRDSVSSMSSDRNSGQFAGSPPLQIQNRPTDRNSYFSNNRQSVAPAAHGDPQKKNSIFNRSEVVSLQVSQMPETLQEKKKVLQKTKFINQLARLEYEEKQEEVHTKYTRSNRETVLKKIKAKNQIAEFIEEEDEQDVGYDELYEFTYGKSKNNDFFYEKKEELAAFAFCELCDTVHNDHPEVHSTACDKKRKEDPEVYSPFSDQYKKACLARIQESAHKIRSPEYERLGELLGSSPQKLRSGKRQVEELLETSGKDEIFRKMCQKVLKIIG